MSAVIEISAICPVRDHVRLATAFATTSASLADVSGMTFVLEENCFYWIEVFGRVQTAATTTGFALGATYPSSGASASLLLNAPSSVAGTPDGRFQDGVAGVVSATTASMLAATTDLPFHALFYVATGAESGSPSTGIVGSFQLQFATEVAGSNAQLSVGTVMRVMKFDQAVATAALTLQAPGFGASYSTTDLQIGPSASATITLTYLADGTWTIESEPDDSLSGTPASGNWGTPTTAGAGSNYEVRFTVSGQSGGHVSNSANDWTPLSEDRTFSFGETSTGGVESGSLTVTAEVRQRGTTTVGSTGSTSLTVTAEAAS